MRMIMPDTSPRGFLRDEVNTILDCGVLISMDVATRYFSSSDIAASLTHTDL